MNRLRLVIPAALCLTLAAACSAPQVSASMTLSYDAAVSAEILYLNSGKATAAEATKLQALRIRANRDRAAVVAAEAAGSSTAGVAPLASAAIAAYLTEAQTVAGVKP